MKPFGRMMQASGATDHYPRGGIFTFLLVRGWKGNGTEGKPPSEEEAARCRGESAAKASRCRGGVHGRSRPPQRRRGLVSPTAAGVSTHHAATAPEACKITARCAWRICKIPARSERRIHKDWTRSGRFPDGDITVARQGCGGRMGERSAEAARCHIPLQPYPLLQGETGRGWQP